MNAAIDLDSAITELAQEYAGLVSISLEEAWRAIAELVREHGVEGTRRSVTEYAAIGAKIENEKFSHRMGWPMGEEEEMGT